MSRNQVAKASASANPTAATSGGVGLVKAALDWVLHLDTRLTTLAAQHGPWAHAILAAIVFCETGLVVTPLLPGDSLLFAAGAVAGMGFLDVRVLMFSLLTAAVLGDAVNYALGRNLGEVAFSKYPGVFKPEYLQKTRDFFAKYGGKTVVIARFVPIVRTFAPFVAGVGSMEYRRFALYNVLGGCLWTLSFVLMGFLFGGLPVVKKNFSVFVFGIVAVSLLPIAFELRQSRPSGGGGGGPAIEPPPQSAPIEDRVADRKAWISRWRGASS